MLHVDVHYPGRRIEDTAKNEVRFEFVLPKRPFLFWADRCINEWLSIPKGYGVAYRDFPRNRVLMAPMPLNIVVGSLIWLYKWIKYTYSYWLLGHLPPEFGICNLKADPILRPCLYYQKTPRKFWKLRARK